jgi:hypothetical protein
MQLLFQIGFSQRTFLPAEPEALISATKTRKQMILTAGARHILQVQDLCLNEESSGDFWQLAA